ncbi:MAG: GH32 C-terminal domain-containing protein, partial [Muribaculaceae bacterium]|nr:GH32 C-terminal domain-containing protein [Muribaculaceae bacterium]
DYYAAVSFSNAPADRTVLLGWMSNWQYANEVPTRQYRSANSIARDIALFRANDGEIYVASVPAAEMDAVRGKAIDYHSAKLAAKGKTYRLPDENDGICEIVCNIDTKDNSPVTLTLANAQGEKVVMTINPAADTFSMDRTKSGITDFSDNFPCVTVAPARSNDNKVWNLRIFIDRSSVEAFSADGHFVMTNLVFPTSPYNTLTLSQPSAKGMLKSLKVYPVKVASK